MSAPFDERNFRAKLRRHALTAGRGVVEKALQLFYASRSPATPAWARSVIYGALAYFVVPIDAIPDLVPGAGYTDDFWTLAAAVGSVALYIDEDVRRKANEKVADWFGDGRYTDPLA